MTISKELPNGCERPVDMPGDAGLMECIPGAELTAHLG